MRQQVVTFTCDAGGCGASVNITQAPGPGALLALVSEHGWKLSRDWDEHLCPQHHHLVGQVLR